ncbi:TPA: Shiga toxin Stx2 subunit B [Escherichia coli]|uniref:Shiga toxin Stx2 subunit B n=1 Tax=Escherichia coli TaxID=562 RepID=UPI001763B6AE|nr:Shiga toxin Stx2 subunit B [Escherichia coli]EER8891619.1 Shiga toxin Stx2 subunit B [Escherichia coli]EER8891786.1 Shiga toxin Stx2 subunit B [Escherichia coli]EER9030267.1 Shiga toxin Stx2 subunit B [Escherichia coli]EER9030328.1 Shiga toxin Stx2 subunit B [Escherichia coli]EHY2052362.1 Shiga toxin Stx2 subunit B [Escherichia coli]
MKTMFMAVLFALVSVNAMAADCAKGKIEFSKYNEDDTFTVKVDGKEYWTSRWNLQPLLQSAQLTGMTVTIKSSTCESGSGFAEVQFNND